ncbi:MAG TPA: M23 family metallopeptidase [Polyangia bacterium]|nr:M23 family metallopeptidase [Polyangia bacterium]
MAPRWMLLLAVVPVIAVGSAGCHFSRAPMHPEAPPGSWYVVSRGETLDDIAKRAGVPAEDILELNGLARAEDVKPGRLIFVLASQEPSNEAALPRGPTGAAIASSEAAPPPGAARFRWPLANVPHEVGSPFGTRDGRAHEGIDLPAPTGTPVVAAADGEVVYAGDGIRGYGNLVVLQHPGDLLTVYAHNSALFVAPGQAVRAGDRIAAVGQTGRATGPHLHFEVRQGQIPRDPMSYLSGGAG